MPKSLIRAGYAGVAMVCLSIVGAAAVGPFGLAAGPGIVVGAKWLKMS